VTAGPVWPVVLVDDGGWVEVLRSPGEFRVEPAYSDEVAAVFDRTARRFAARNVEDEVVLVPASDGPDLPGLLAAVAAASARWAPHLGPLRTSSALAAFDRAEVFGRHRRRPVLATVRGWWADRWAGGAVDPYDQPDVRDLLDEAARLVDDLQVRWAGTPASAGLDVAVSSGVVHPAVETWGVHAFLWDGHRAREHWELLAHRRPGARDWTVVRDAAEAVSRIEDAVRGWTGSATAGKSLPATRPGQRLPRSRRMGRVSRSRGGPCAGRPGRAGGRPAGRR
jgi:hypothetical protein